MPPRKIKAINAKPLKDKDPKEDTTIRETTAGIRTPSKRSGGTRIRETTVLH